MNEAATTTVQVTATKQRQLVIFELGEEAYAVDIHQVREIIRIPDITRLPRTPDFIEGVINLRGGVIPVLDLAHRFGRTEATDASETARIVIVELGDQLLGMRVDGVSEVLSIDSEQIEPPSPYIINVDSQFLTGIARLDERLVILLDLNRVLIQEEREQLKAAAAVFADYETG